MLRNRLYPSCRDTILEEDFSLVTKIGLCWRGDNWLTESREIAVLLAGFGRNPISMEPGKSCSQKGVSSESSQQLCLRALLTENAALGGCHPQWTVRAIRYEALFTAGEVKVQLMLWQDAWPSKGERTSSCFIFPELTDSVVRPSKWTKYLYLIFIFTRHAQDNGCGSERLELLIWFFVSPNIS